jgi:hypothetical protein
MCFSFQKVNPLMNVITLDESVGREFSTARAMRTGVGQQYGESVGQKEIRISDHAQAIVGQTMQQDRCVSVRTLWPENPAA